MGKIGEIAAIAVGVKEVFGEIASFFESSISGEYYEVLDKLTFLTGKILGFNSNGNIVDETYSLAETTKILSNFCIWGILLFYLFLSLFGYFLSKKVEVPWNVFIRTIIFGILINASFFICYSAVYFTENVTEAIMGNEEISFLHLEDMSEDLELILDEELEEIDVFYSGSLEKISFYLLIFFFCVLAGARFLVLKILIIGSPIIFAFGCTKHTEKIFVYCVKKFLMLLNFQIIVAILLNIFKNINFTGDAILRIFIISVLFIAIKIFKKIL